MNTRCEGVEFVECELRLVAQFHGFCDANANQVQVDIHRTGRDGLLNDQGNGFEKIFEEAALGVVYIIAQSGDSLIKQANPSGNVAQSQATFGRVDCFTGRLALLG